MTSVYTGLFKGLECCIHTTCIHWHIFYLEIHFVLPDLVATCIPVYSTIIIYIVIQTDLHVWNNLFSYNSSTFYQNFTRQGLWSAFPPLYHCNILNWMQAAIVCWPIRICVTKTHVLKEKVNNKNWIHACFAMRDKR